MKCIEQILWQWFLQWLWLFFLCWEYLKCCVYSVILRGIWGLFGMESCLWWRVVERICRAEKAPLHILFGIVGALPVVLELKTKNMDCLSFWRLFTASWSHMSVFKLIVAWLVRDPIVLNLQSEPSLFLCLGKSVLTSLNCCCFALNILKHWGLHRGYCVGTGQMIEA